MLTRLRLSNFKRFSNVDIELGQNVVFMGPNNSGKTSALQALTLWELGLRTWLAKRGESKATKRTGVIINRRDVLAAPVPAANLLWHDLHTRNTQLSGSKKKTTDIPITIEVMGVSNGSEWTCALEFDLGNSESIYCRPVSIPPPDEAQAVRVAFLQPMSGLSSNEVRLDQGAVDVRIGEGKSAEVLRNLCHLVRQQENGEEAWVQIRDSIRSLFGVDLVEPIYVAARGELTMTYRERSGAELDLSNAGRGLQQTLLLLSYLHLHRGKVLLLDEPDAHLEFLRQSQTFRLVTEVAQKTSGQVIIASHSEVVLNEAADKDVVIAFVGKPHRIDDRGTQVVKALKSIGFEHYLQAEQTGWVLYAEGSTDVSILRGFATLLDHPAKAALERPYFFPIGSNEPGRAREHFYGVREAVPHLKGVLLVDRLGRPLTANAPELTELMWKRREIENYLLSPSTLLAWAADGDPAADGAKPGTQVPTGTLFSAADRQHRIKVMDKWIGQLVVPIALKNPGDRWWSDVKASDEFLDRLFVAYYQELGLPNLMRKSDYHTLVRFCSVSEIDPEIVEKLDAIAMVASRATPAL